MINLSIRKALPTDIDELQKIGKQSFGETFSSANTPENISQYLDDSFSLNKLRHELNNPDSEFYFAVFESNVIGYLKVNFGQAQTELKDKNTMEIERIYVLKEHHGKRAGQLLFDKAKQIAVEAQVDYVWLGVWENNFKAIEFYKKNGFVEFDRHVFRLGNDEQTDIMMKLALAKKGHGRVA